MFTALLERAVFHFPEVIISEHRGLAVEIMPSLRYQKMRFFSFGC